MIAWNTYVYGSAANVVASAGLHRWMPNDKARIGSKLTYYSGLFESTLALDFGDKEGLNFGVEGGLAFGSGLVGPVLAAGVTYAVQVGETISVGPTIAARYTSVAGIGFYGPEVRLTVTIGRRDSDATP
jgi:hypothetical protein